VFVIISTILIQNFGWQWVDPLCSLILSMLILASIIPLLKSSASILLQSLPDDLDEKQCEEIQNEVFSLVHLFLNLIFFRYFAWKVFWDVQISIAGS
jgi:Co/Zn/Cd efflux system component